jgi:hypothetical protein
VTAAGRTPPGTVRDEITNRRMVIAGEHRVAQTVADWRNDNSALYVLPPCGRCRELNRQVEPVNVDADSQPLDVATATEPPPAARVATSTCAR